MQLSLEPPQVAAQVGIGDIEGEIIEDLRQRLAQVALRPVAAGLSHARIKAARWTGAVNKHGFIADTVMTEQRTEDRVVPGLRQLIVQAQIDQFDIGMLDDRPAAHVQQHLTLEKGPQVRCRLRDLLHVHNDTCRRGALRPLPLCLLETRPRAFGDSLKVLSVVVKAQQYLPGYLGIQRNLRHADSFPAGEPLLLLELLFTEDISEKHRRQIALTRVRQDHDNGAPVHFRALSQTHRSCHGGTTGNSAEDAFFAHEAQGHVLGLFVIHQLDPVNQRQVQVLWYETGADTLDLMWAGFDLFLGQRLSDDRRTGRLDRHTDDLLALGLFDVARDTGQGAAGSHARNQHIDAAIRVVPDFRTGSLLVNSRVGWVLELLRHVIQLGVRGSDFTGLLDGALHPLGRIGQHQFGTQSL